MKINRNSWHYKAYELSYSPASEETTAKIARAWLAAKKQGVCPVVEFSDSETTDEK